MIKDLGLYSEHILKNIEVIFRYIGTSSKEEFAEDGKTYDAVLYKLQTMAEFTQKLPQDIKIRYQEIPWKKISDFRNVIVHDYLGEIDHVVIWNIIKIQLPQLKEVMLKIAKELDLKE